MCTICNWHSTLVSLNRFDYTKEYLMSGYARDVYNSTPYWYNRMLEAFNKTACNEHKLRMKFLLEEGISQENKLWEERQAYRKNGI